MRCALLPLLLFNGSVQGTSLISGSGSINGGASRSAVRSPASLLQRPLRVRGGADGVAESARDGQLGAPALPEDTAAKEGRLAEPGSEKDQEPAITCWVALKRVVDFIVSFFSPKYDYARVKTEILGNASQMNGYAADDESWRTARKKINDVELSPPARKRVLRDLRRLKQDENLGLFVDDCECITDWVVKLVGAPGTVYEGEIYRLRFRFHPDYPAKAPEVTFMRPAPVHEHIYSDGKICLNILYSDWDPKLDVRAVCLSLLSMLSSAKKKSRPPDNNSTVVLSRGQKTRNMQWEFHDDNC